MRGGRSPVAVLLAVSLALAGALPTAAQPQLRLPGLSGGALDEASLAQGATIVVVWAGWSPRCRDIVSRVNRIAQRWGDEARVVTVNFQEDAAAVREFLRGQDLQAPVFLDGDGAFSKKHSVTTLPSLLIFKDGRNGYRGRLPDDADAVISPILQ